VSEVKYLSNKPDPSKVKAIAEMTPSTDKAGIRCLLGMINYLVAHTASRTCKVLWLLYNAY